jgi:STE24 endopeptidase
MVLPAAALYGLGVDVVSRYWPAAAESTWEQPLSLVVLGVVVLTLAPAFVRIAWPTRPLPPGPLRDRLERLAQRAGFRCTDILLWDTNQAIVNAGVTGFLPWYRYVLLTDALVDGLNPHEIAAVFGHEIGHIAHRHLLYFGFFILGSLAVLVFGGEAAAPLRSWTPPAVETLVWGDSTVAQIVQVAAGLAIVGLYFLAAFGYVSRRFERQADVFGCRAVSCGRPDCPPHADFDGRPGPSPPAGAMELCPVGVRIFVSALSNVAMLNGMRPTAWSWRHGSIVRRIAFLESLVDRPDAERRFQTGVRRMRRGVAVALLAAVAVLAALTSWTP